MLAFCATAMAQSSTNSPYSQFGLGLLSDQSAGFSRGMNGVSLAFHEHNQVNHLNPASYANIDSLTFIFDVGASGQISNFNDHGAKFSAKSAAFEYAVGGFRLMKHFGLAFGITPYTNIGYSYSTTQDVGDNRNTTATYTYSGDGGLHQVFLGLGYMPLKGLSIGVNGSYLYGDFSRSATNTFSDSYINSLTKEYSADVRSYKLEFGAQYEQALGKKDKVSLGLTYSPGHDIGGKPRVDIISVNSQTSLRDTTSFPGSGQPNLHFEMPTTFGVGLMYDHNGQLKIGADYTLQKWKDVDQPVYGSAGNGSYTMASGTFKDRHKVVLGADYTPGGLGRGFFSRLHYRAGVGYATPYYYIDGHDGPKEISASLGVGIPILNAWNTRSVLNVSGQWVRQSAKDFITDNTFRINISLTFNEKWFSKWKVD